MTANPERIAEVRLPSCFDRDAAPELVESLNEAVRNAGDEVALDLREVERFDSAGMAVILDTLKQARARGVKVRLLGLSDALYDFFTLVSIDRLLRPGETTRGAGFIERVGGVFVPMIDALRHGVSMLGFAVWSVVAAPFRGDKARADMAVDEMYLAGNGGISVVTLIGFLLGAILAMQAWVQLRLFSAEIFIADMVAVSVTREIGPLMTAILLAARSGSSIAAKLGTMVINEEVDALRQMGIHPVKYLVSPKVLALAAVAPCLCILFCAVAIIGGMLFGVLVAGIEWGAYIEQTHKALKLADLFSGLVKSSTFGVVVAVVGSTLGLGVKGGSEGVGLATTRSVVSSIFLIICVDAVFVLLLRVGA